MKKITLADMTLKNQAHGAKFTMSFKEKLELAKELDKLGVEVIETAPILNEKADVLLLKSISAAVKNSIISCPVGVGAESIGAVWEAISGAKEKRLLVSLPVSTVQMEYSYGKKAADMLTMISELVGECRKFTGEVEFFAQDATRAEGDFLCEVIETAISAGAAVINISDTAGTMFPEEFSAFLSDLYERVPALSSVRLSVSCSDSLHMAAAQSLASIGAGAVQIKTIVRGTEAASLEQVADIIRARGDSLELSTSLDMTGFRRSIQRMLKMTGSQRTANSAFREEIMPSAEAANILLDSATGISGVSTALKSLGYDLSGEELSRVYEDFQRIADKKPVGAKELEAIVASTAIMVPATYKLLTYVINSGNVITATANVQIEKDGESIVGLKTGDGPIDAAFLAIEQITGRHFELEDFQINSVTEGKEAVGEALVKLRSEGKLYSGIGVSTDIIGAAIRAYIDALNKIVYEERQ